MDSLNETKTHSFKVKGERKNETKNHSGIAVSNAAGYTLG